MNQNLLKDYPALQKLKDWYSLKLTNSTPEGGSGGGESSEFIKLKVGGQDSREIHIHVNKNTQMGKLKQSYSEMVGVPITSLRFLFDGRRISDDETPKQLEMENYNVIEVYKEKVDGGPLMD